MAMNLTRRLKLLRERTGNTLRRFGNYEHGRLPKAEFVIDSAFGNKFRQWERTTNIDGQLIVMCVTFCQGRTSKDRYRMAKTLGPNSQVIPRVGKYLNFDDGARKGLRRLGKRKRPYSTVRNKNKKTRPYRWTWLPKPIYRKFGDYGRSRGRGQHRESRKPDPTIARASSFRDLVNVFERYKLSNEIQEQQPYQVVQIRDPDSWFRVNYRNKSPLRFSRKRTGTRFMRKRSVLEDEYMNVHD